MIIPRSGENFWGANAGTDSTNYGVPLVLGASRVRKGKPVQEQPSPPRSSGNHVPDWAKIISLTSLRRRSLRRQPCSWIESTEADHLLPTTKVLVASPTQRAYGNTSHHRCSPPADDQLFFSGSDITISYMQTLSQPASIGWTAARAQPEAATTERNQLGRLSWRPPTR